MAAQLNGLTFPGSKEQVEFMAELVRQFELLTARQDALESNVKASNN